MDRTRQDGIVTTLLEDSTIPEESGLLDVLERYADLVDEIRLIVTERHSGRLAWEGIADRLAICTWGRLLRRWRHAVRPDRPPYSLVVRLSKDLPELLRQVTASPKRVLRREREREPLHRIREFDSTCMRWVCRQPGVTLAEKAGHQRSLLAVRRFESINTLENRVVLTLVRRSVGLCRDYLRQHAEAFAGHERVLGVQAHHVNAAVFSMTRSSLRSRNSRVSQRRIMYCCTTIGITCYGDCFYS